MGGLFGGFHDYYYLIIALQGFCAWHSFRRGTQQKWIWIIIFLPVIGSAIYIFTEIIKKQHVNSIQSSVLDAVNPGGRIKQLEHQLQFSDTLTNRIELAEAYIERGENKKALALYEHGLQGIYQDNERIIKQLVTAHYNLGNFEEIIRIVPKIKQTLYFFKKQDQLIVCNCIGKNRTS